MIYITGDIHCPIDIKKLANKNFPEGKTLTKNDYLIICGDTALVWSGGSEEKWWQKWLTDKPYTTLFVDGNHDNHEMLAEYPVTEWNGGKAHFITPSLIHLMRGQVFTLEDHTFLTIGGAESHDRAFRKEGRDWWSGEQFCEADYRKAMSNLTKYNKKVDFVISHDCPTNILRRVNPSYEESDTNMYFEEIWKQIEFREWYFGHHHKDALFVTVFDETFRCLYKDIVKLDI